MKKTVFYTEIAFAAALILLAFGTALTERAGLGISMVVAPAYLLYLRLAPVLPWFSFGMAEYFLQAVVLLGMMLLLRRGRVAYLLSFATAVIYGLLLDGAMALVRQLLLTQIWQRICVYGFGVALCTAAIALLFYSYFPPAAYELFVKEISRKWGKDIHRCKTIYDCSSCFVAVIMSIIFYGTLRGIGIGTLICAVLYGPLIRMFSRVFQKTWTFQDCLRLRSFFEESEEFI